MSWPHCSRLDGLRLQSAATLSAQAQQIRADERRIHALEQRLGRTPRWQAGMNVVGLVIVLLAELPIWRRCAGSAVTSDEQARRAGDPSVFGA